MTFGVCLFDGYLYRVNTFLSSSRICISIRPHRRRTDRNPASLSLSRLLFVVLFLVLSSRVRLQSANSFCLVFAVVL